MANLQLKKLRTSMNLTQADVAERLRISRGTYSRYETGEREMTYDTLIELAELFSVSVDYLIGRGECITTIISDDEMPILYQFRALDDRGKRTVQMLIEFEQSLNCDNS